MKRSTARLWFAFALCAVLLAAALMLLFYVNTPRSSEVIAAATATRAISTPLVVETTPPIAATDMPAPLFAFGALGEVETIQITDDEDAVSIVQRHFQLQKQDSTFVGDANFNARNYPYPVTPVSFVRKVTVPQDAIQSFLAMLAQLANEAPIEPPRTIVPLPDCYPIIILRLHTKNGDTVFSSKSCQHDNNMMWDVEYKGNKTSTFTNTPKYALSLLIPYLRYDVLDSVWQHETPKL